MNRREQTRAIVMTLGFGFTATIGSVASMLEATTPGIAVLGFFPMLVAGTFYIAAGETDRLEVSDDAA